METRVAAVLRNTFPHKKPLPAGNVSWRALSWLADSWILEAYCSSVGLETTACWHLTAGWYFGLLFVASLLIKQNCSTDL